jgi:hypothetical protein
VRKKKEKMTHFLRRREVFGMKRRNKVKSDMRQEIKTACIIRTIFTTIKKLHSGGSFVSIMTKLRTRRVGLNSPARAMMRFFPIRHRVQTGSGTHTASYPMITGGSFSRVKRPGREAYHSTPTSVEVENAWSYTHTIPIHFHGVVFN